MKKNIKKLLMATLPGIIIPVAMVANSCGSDSADLWLITDSGNVNDQSFNQQSYEAIQNVSKEFDMTNKYIKPANTDPSTLIGSYKTAMSNGAKSMVLSGFQHSAAATTFFSAAENKSLYQNVHTYFVDGDLGADVPAGLADSNFTSIEFKAEQSGFLAGYTIAKWLMDNNRTPSTSPKVATYGGLKFNTVFGYMNGFDYGIGAANHDNSTSAKVQELGPDGTPITASNYTFTSDFQPAAENSTLADKTTGNYSGSFEPGEARAQSLSSTFVKDGASVILPVAGPQTVDTINAIKSSSKQNVYVLGVDTPNEIHYSDLQQYILGSALKNIQTAVVSALKTQFNGNWDGNAWCTSASGTYDQNSHVCKGGFNSDANKSWVGMSLNPTFAKNLQTAYNAALVELNKVNALNIDILEGIYGHNN